MTQKFSKWVALMSTVAAKRQTGATYDSDLEGDMAMLKMLPPAKTTEELEYEMFGLKQVQEYMALVRGGQLATSNEATYMIATPSMPRYTGYTVNLNVNHRKQVNADQFVMVKGEFMQTEGRKGWSKAAIHDLEGTVLADATALFVSPFKPDTIAITHVATSTPP
ncbi:hypothetical protein BGZ94_007992 [Podila epigama]|nr:hypothetical protein BGZ94_007992 [Podila epigama]